MTILLMTLAFGFAGDEPPARPAKTAAPANAAKTAAAVEAVRPVAAAASETMKTAFLFGVSVPRKRPPGEAPRFGVDAERIDWWLGDPDGSNLRLLDNPDGGRVACEPIDQTIILKRTDDEVVLLGPDGGDLTLSLKTGPLADAMIERTGQRTTFSFGPDRKSVWFVNKAGRVNRIDLATNQLRTFPPENINRAGGVRFSPDGKYAAFGSYVPDPRTGRGSAGFHVAKLPDLENPIRLAVESHGKVLAFGFLPNGRVGVAHAKGVRSFDPATGAADDVAGPWKETPRTRASGGFSPDGSRLLFDIGGPYVLDLFVVEAATGKVTMVKENYLESFQSMVWVRLKPRH